VRRAAAKRKDPRPYDSAILTKKGEHLQKGGTSKNRQEKPHKVKAEVRPACKKGKPVIGKGKTRKRLYDGG